MNISFGHHRNVTFAGQVESINNSASFEKCNFEGAVFVGVNFHGVLFNQCSFVGAVFRNCKGGFNGFRCDFEGARFEEGDLKLDLDRSYMRIWVQRDTKFRGQLYRCDLQAAHFYGADIHGLEMIACNLYCAQFEYCVGVPVIRRCFTDSLSIYSSDRDAWKSQIPLVCPEEGDFVAYKKVIGDGMGLVATLLIQGDRSSAMGRKCRTSKAKVLSIKTLAGEPFEGEAKSMWDISFKYRTGETVQATFDRDWTEECAQGIHFFMTRQEAIDY